MLELVRLKLTAVRAGALAVTEYVPLVVFAVKTGEIASPLEFDDTWAVVEPPAKVPLAPVVGAVKVTVTPETGLP
jgi:hypothetical protein